MGKWLKRPGEDPGEQAIASHLEDSGRDGLELAARVALAAYDGVKARLSPNREYRLGYRTALAELAVVLRAMRKGEPPSMEAMGNARRVAVEAVDAEFELGLVPE